MTRPATSKPRSRGTVETLPSGSLRVKVYAGSDPLTGRDVYLREVVPAGPQAQRRAEKVRTKLLAQVDQRRNPRTTATVDQLLDRCFELMAVDERTLADYRSLADNHVRPLLGRLQLGRIDGETLDTFYRRLRSCRHHCAGSKHAGHRVRGKHQCDERCDRHQPLSNGTLRKIQSILGGAGQRAVRWEWIGVNPFDLADPIPVPPPAPTPPTAEQAALIVTDAWRDIDWGMLVWLAMVTGARRGELCALRWDRLDVAARTLVIRSSVSQRGGRTWEKDTKTHQQRRIALDETTFELLTTYRRACAERVGVDDMSGQAFIFSGAPDGRVWLKPDTVSQRYSRQCARRGWDMHIHQLRHYSATELIAAGVDVRTVAGRLGHGGGGTTTLKVYTAWVAEADQRAAGSLSVRMPAPPAVLGSAALAASTADAASVDYRYRQIAEDFAGAIACGVLRAGDQLPPQAELAARYGVVQSTVKRAYDVLQDKGLITKHRGARAVVRDSKASVTASNVVSFEDRRAAP